MAEQLVEPDYLRNSRLWYPPETAPFGELNIVRVEHNSQAATPVERRAEAVNMTFVLSGPRLIREAWQQSEWLEAAVGLKKSRAFMAGEDYKPLVNRVEKGIISAWAFPKTKSAWFAVRPAKDDADQWPVGQLGLIAPSQIVGFANAGYDVSGSLLQRLVKRLRHPEKVYAKIGNVAVDPADQSQGIGSALFYTSLGMFPEDKRPTTYVETPNERLMNSLRTLGYAATGSQTRVDLVQGARIEEVRFQADSVKAVRERMVERLPWLEGAIPVAQ